MNTQTLSQADARAYGVLRAFRDQDAHAMWATVVAACGDTAAESKWTRTAFDGLTVLMRESAPDYWPTAAEIRDWCFVVLARPKGHPRTANRTFFISGRGAPGTSPTDVAVTTFIGGTPGEKDGEEFTREVDTPVDGILTMAAIARAAFGLDD